MKSTLIFWVFLSGISNKMLFAQQNGFTLDDIKILSGSWTGDAFGGKIEEIWTKPESGCKIGMYRTYNDKRIGLLEFLMITEDQHGGTLKFKHFDINYNAKEESPLVLKLISIENYKFIFESDIQNKPKRLIYDFIDSDHLVVTVENEIGGTAESFNLNMKRAE